MPGFPAEDENFQYEVPISKDNVRNLARLFETNPSQIRPANLVRAKSKSSTSITVKKSFDISSPEIRDDNQLKKNLSFRDIHTKFESGTMVTRSTSMQRMMSSNSLECLKLQEIKDISSKTDEIVVKVKESSKAGSKFCIFYLNEIVELLLKIGQVETNGYSSIQSEKLSTLQVLQKCYSQLKRKLEVFLFEDSEQPEDEKISIRSSIEKWENMIDKKAEGRPIKNCWKPTYQDMSNTHTNNINSVQKELEDEEEIREIEKSKVDISETKKEEVDVIKYEDAEIDEEVLGNVKVKNLKDIWERRASCEDILSEKTVNKSSTFSSNDIKMSISAVTNLVKSTTRKFEEISEPSNEIPIEDTVRRNETIYPQTRENIELVKVIDLEDRIGNEIHENHKDGEIISNEEVSKTSNEYVDEDAVKENPLQIEFVPEPSTENEDIPSRVTLVSTDESTISDEVHIVATDGAEENVNFQTRENIEVVQANVVKEGISHANQTLQEDRQIEDNKEEVQKNIEKFIEEERKSSSDNFHEDEVEENPLVIEFLPEPSANSEEIQSRVTLATDNGNINSNEENITVSDTKEKDDDRDENIKPEKSGEDVEHNAFVDEENKVIEGQLAVLTTDGCILVAENKQENSEERSPIVLVQGDQDNIARNECNKDRISSNPDEETVKEEATRINKEIKDLHESKIPSTKDFLNKERKDSEENQETNYILENEEIDARFGPPTVIIPSGNPDDAIENTAEEKVPDDKFIIVVDKGDDNENAPNDTTLLLAGGETRASSVENTPTDESKKDRKSANGTVKEEATKINEEIKDLHESIIPSTKDFLNKERKDSEDNQDTNYILENEEIDVRFGPPTGIIPSGNPVDVIENIAEEKVPDDKFIIIVDQVDDNENVPNDTTLLLVGGETHASSEENIPTDSSLILDNGPVQVVQIEENVKENDLTIENMVNGDKDIQPK